MLILSPKDAAMHTANYRRRAKLTQKQVAESVGLLQKTISGFENNPSNTKLDTFFRILSANNLEMRISPKESKESPNLSWDGDW